MRDGKKWTEIIELKYYPNWKLRLYSQKQRFSFIFQFCSTRYSYVYIRCIYSIRLVFPSVFSELHFIHFNSKHFFFAIFIRHFANSFTEESINRLFAVNLFFVHQNKKATEFTWNFWVDNHLNDNNLTFGRYSPNLILSDFIRKLNLFTTVVGLSGLINQCSGQFLFKF